MAYTLTDEDKRLAQQMADSALASQIKQPAPVSKPQERGNWFTNSLSTAGGILGAVGGSFLGPGVGTAAGGAAGAGAGKFLENLFEGNNAGEGVLGEAALGTLGGVGKGFKALKGAATAGRTGGNALDILRNGVPKTSGAPTSRGESILGGVATRAREFDAKTSGLGVGQKINGQTVTPQRSQELYNFSRTRGVKSGSPMSQAKQAEELLRNTTNQLDTTLGTINRGVTKDELIGLTSAATSKVADNAAVTGTTKTLGKFNEKISKAKDLKELEAIRREADDLAYSATGAKKTAAAAQAKAVRETIDDFVTGVSPGYKALKGDYRNAKDTLELTTKAAGSGSGGIDILGNKFGSTAIPAMTSKGSSILARVFGGGTPPAGQSLKSMAGGSGGTPPGVPPGLPPAGSILGGTQASSRGGMPDWAKIAGMQLGGRALTGNLPGQDVNVQPVDGASILASNGPAPASGQTVGQTNPSGSANSTGSSTGSMYTRENAAMDIQNDLQRTGGENMEKYLKLFEFMNPVETTEKPLSAEASKVLANANSGLESLGQLSDMIDKSGVPLGTVLPGRDMLGGLGASILGTSGYDTAAKNVADVITRLRTGAALTEAEEKFYKAQLPQAFDPDDVKQQKIQMFADLFNSISSRTGTAGTDTEGALATAAGY